MGVSDLDPDANGRRPWNAGNMVGAKRPLRPRDVWANYISSIPRTPAAGVRIEIRHTYNMTLLVVTPI